MIARGGAQRNPWSDGWRRTGWKREQLVDCKVGAVRVGWVERPRATAQSTRSPPLRLRRDDSVTSFLADMGGYYVRVPEERESVYQWAGPLFLALALAAAGVWLARFSRVRSPVARALLWATAGFAAASLTAWCIWANRENGAVNVSWLASATVYAPCLWILGSAIFIAYGWRSIRRPTAQTEAKPPVEGTDK
jgi:hypothetical protein